MTAGTFGIFTLFLVFCKGPNHRHRRSEERLAVSITMIRPRPTTVRTVVITASPTLKEKSA